MISTDRPLSGLRAQVVGAGRVGASAAYWFAALGATIEAVAGRSGSTSAARLAEEVGCPAVDVATLTSSGADLLLLALPDAALADAAERLARRPQASVALHVAGALGAEVLAPLRAAGTAIGTWHPLRAFPEPARDPSEAAGTFFALDGDPPAVALGARLANALGGDSAVVAGEDRLLYHFAATLAAGGVTTLLTAVADLSDGLGLPPAARAGYLELARGALVAAGAASDPAEAVTGPVARGDVATVTAHLRELRRADPNLLPLALELARETLRRLALRGAPNAAQRALAERLESPDLLDRPKDRVLTSLPKP